MAVEEFAVERDHRRFFGGQTDSRHRLDGLHRVAAGRRFGREHHRVGAVKHRVGDVRDLGAGRRRRQDHRFHHLRRGDRQLVFFARHANHAFLQRRDRGVADFDGQVAARDHQPVRGIEDFFERGHRFDALDLGDGQRVAAAGEHQLARHIHVGSALGERHGEKISADLRRRADVFHVLGGQRRRRQAAALAIDSLVVREHAADAYRGIDFLADDVVDVEHDAAIVEQQHVARTDVVRQVLVIEADAQLVAEFALGVENEAVADFERDLAFLELADADLRPLQVGEDADRPADLGRDGAHAGGQRDVILRLAMREVEADDVDAGADQGFEDERVA